jgi:hypothetical protein
VILAESPTTARTAARRAFSLDFRSRSVVLSRGASGGRLGQRFAAGWPVPTVEFLAGLAGAGWVPGRFGSAGGGRVLVDQQA